MSMLALKHSIEAGLAPMARRIPFAPNTITLIGVLAMALAAVQVARNDLLGAGLWVLASGLLDLLDGSVAKARGLSTPFGALLDRVADRVADFLILAALTLNGLVPDWLGVLTIGLVLTGSYVSACLEAQTASPVGEAMSLRAWRIVVLAAGCIAGTPVWAVAALAVAGGWAVAARLAAARRLLSDRAPGRPGSSG